MRIEGPGGIRHTTGVTSAARPKKAAGTSAASFADMVSTDSTTEGVTDVSPIIAIDQLLGLQEVDDPTTGRRQAQQRGFDILDKLDLLRLQILEGRISKDQLQNLARMVSARRASATDPKLIEILDDIDLRAQVEIAKFTRDFG